MGGPFTCHPLTQVRGVMLDGPRRRGLTRRRKTRSTRSGIDLSQYYLIGFRESGQIHGTCTSFVIRAPHLSSSLSCLPKRCIQAHKALSPSKRVIHSITMSGLYKRYILRDSKSTGHKDSSSSGFMRALYVLVISAATICWLAC